MQYRDYYYMLSNIEQFPEMYSYSATIVEQFLDVARTAIQQQTFKKLPYHHS